MKKKLALFIALLLVFSSTAMVSAKGSDYENNWAKEEISYMVEKGVLAGYPDGTFKPQNNMSQAEFYRVINELMGYSEKGEVKFSDVKADDWYYGEVEKGVKANYILPGEKLNANAKISRAEVARIISIVFDVDSNKEAAASFKDNADFSEEMKGIIGGLKAKNFISGRPDGTFDGKANITRAEAVRMLYTISGEILNKAQTFNKDVETNMIVNTADVVLKDMTIDGDLYLAEGIGEGNVLLDGVTVKGHLSIQGGGVNSIIIKNSDINTVSINKQIKSVRVVFENTKVKELHTENTVKLEILGKSEVVMTKLNGDVEVKIEKGSTVDGVLAETDTTIKVEDGKEEEEEKEPVKDESSNSGSSSSSSSSSTMSRKDRIVSDSKDELKKLETSSMAELRTILNEARTEVNNLPENDKSEAKIKEIGKKYMPKAEALEANTDIEVNSILSAMKTKLTDNGYLLATAESEATSLQTEYNKEKAIEEQKIRSEFEADMIKMLEVLFLN